MAKTKDRWERMLDKLPRVFDSEDFHEEIPVYDREQVLKLLRCEHRAVVRTVKKEFLSPIGKSERYAGWNQAIASILSLLAGRSK